MQNFNTEDLLKEFEKLKAAGGFTSSFLKLDVGQHRLRFGPPSHGDKAPFVVRVSHSFFPTGLKNAEGKIESPSCLQHAFEDGRIVQAAMDAKRITQTDIEQYKKNGCPFCRIQQNLYSLGQKEKARHFMPNTQALFNVLNRADNKLYMWSCYSTFVEALVNATSVYPELFDPDNGNDVIVPVILKNGNRKSVGAPIIGPKTAFDSEEELHNLVEVIAAGVYTFAHMQELIEINHGKMLNELVK